MPLLIAFARHARASPTRSLGTNLMMAYIIDDGRLLMLSSFERMKFNSNG
jgi:hypothetical protein